MTEQSQQDETYLTATERGPGRPRLWVGVIPALVIPALAISLVGLAAGFSVLSGAGAQHTERPPGAHEVATVAAGEDLPSRPEHVILVRQFRPAATSTTTGRPLPKVARAAPAPAVPSAPATPSGTSAAREPASASAPGSGCTAALAWLSGHAAPGFSFECPGDALGHQAMTCVNVAGVCPGQRIIAIADACPAAYMNEAHNSWILAGLATGRLDPYGYCS